MRLEESPRFSTTRTHAHLCSVSDVADVSRFVVGGVQGSSLNRRTMACRIVWFNLLGWQYVRRNHETSFSRVCKLTTKEVFCAVHGPFDKVIFRRQCEHIDLIYFICGASSGHTLAVVSKCVSNFLKATTLAFTSKRWHEGNASQAFSLFWVTCVE